jgi:hypothetical protein
MFDDLKKDLLWSFSFDDWLPFIHHPPRRLSAQHIATSAGTPHFRSWSILRFFFPGGWRHTFLQIGLFFIVHSASDRCKCQVQRPSIISATALSAAQLQLQRIPLASWTLKAVDLYHLTRKSLKQEGFKHTHKGVLQSTSSPYHHHCNRNPGMYWWIGGKKWGYILKYVTHDTQTQTQPLRRPTSSYR